MAESFNTNFQYSRIQNKISSISGQTPTIYSGDTINISETDSMVLGRFQSTDILDGEIYLNTTDDRVFIRSNDQILEFIMAGGGLDNIYTSGATLIGTTLYFDRTDTLSAYTADLSSLGQWSGSTGTNSLVPKNQVGNIAGGLASLAGGGVTTASGTTAFGWGANLNVIGDYSAGFGASNTLTGIGSFIAGSNNVITGNYSGLFGGGNIINGDYAFGAGTQLIINGDKAAAFGSSTRANGDSSFAIGGLTYANGQSSFASGTGTIAGGINSFAGGQNSTASGDTSFIFSNTSITEADNSAILGGTGNTLTSGATNSVILGCHDITGTSANTVYACNIDATNYFSGGTNLLSILGGASTLDELSDVTTNLPLTPTEADDGKLLFYDYDIDQWTTDDAVTHGTVVINAKKASAGTIAKGTPVYLVGFDADLHTVEAANASSASTMPVIGLAAEALDDTNSKHITTFGKLTGVDTTTGSTLNPNNEVWAVNDALYMSTTTGGFTKVRPTGTAQIQRIVKVLKVDASGGQLFVFNTARTAGLPNLTSANFWLGDANGIPQEVTMSGDVHMDNAGVTTIQPDSVTYDKMQDVSQAAVLGNENTSGGTVTEIPMVEQYLSTGTVTALLENTSNWDINGVYIGTSITGTYQGQSHYDGNYWFTAVADNVWIRLIRG